MASPRGPGTSTISQATTHHSYMYNSTSISNRETSRRSNARTRNARPGTGISTLCGIENQRIICAVSESRGISPIVGLAFVNIETCEAVLCQICDSQTYVHTLHKLHVYGPSEILIVSTAIEPKSTLLAVIEEKYPDLVVLLDRKYWAETAGLAYIQQLAFEDDLEAIKIAITGNYFAVCCIAAVLKHIESLLSRTFSFHSLRIKYEPSEGSMMIDMSTIRALELIQNLHDPKSKDCLFGLLDETLTPMGSRLLRSNILQPLTSSETLELRYDALEELSVKEDIFHGVRKALEKFVDADKLLTSLIMIPLKQSLAHTEQSVNKMIMLRQLVSSISPIHDALAGAQSVLLREVRQYCAPSYISKIQSLISTVINDDVIYSASPLDLRYQRTFAVKSGVNGLLDVSRTTFKENSDDIITYLAELAEGSGLKLELKFDNVRQHYIRILISDLNEQPLPAEFINIVIGKKNCIECQTLELLKKNQKLVDSHNECLMMSDRTVQGLVEEVRGHLSALFKVCESVAMLDMMASFAQLATTREYCRPQIDDFTLAIKAGRHPIKEKNQNIKFIPNDVYGTSQTRFQIITGYNMSGKSTYLRSIALMVVMAQIGSFVPATFAAFPIHHQLFARVTLEDSLEGNRSTFAAEMQETAFILRNVDARSIVIIDELGRGTSNRDGLAIAIGIAEALVDSKALVWFATHFRDLGTVLSERNGVTNLHLAVELSNVDADADATTMMMLYKVAEGPVKDEHYGLALARLMPLPVKVIEHATRVAGILDRQQDKDQRSSLAVIVQRRRRLVLDLKEYLTQAQRGQMGGKTLTAWLAELQRTFVAKMSLIDVELAHSSAEEEDD